MQRQVNGLLIQELDTKHTKHSREKKNALEMLIFIRSRHCLKDIKAPQPKRVITV